MDCRLQQAIMTDDTATFMGLVGENEELLEQRVAGSLHTVLHMAARIGNVEMVTELLKLRPEMVGAENKRSETPLHEACRKGDVEVLRLLLAEANLSVTSKLNCENHDALFIACSYGHLNAVNLILDLPWFFLEVQDGDHSTPLHVAALKGHTNIVRKLLDKCPELAQMTDKNGWSALHCACSRGNFEVSKVLLRIDPELSTLYDSHGHTPLHLAAMNGNVETLEEFILTAPTSFQLLSRKQGETVFHLTIRFNQFDAFMCLAKVFRNTQIFHKCDNFGNTLSNLVLYAGNDRYAEYIRSEAIATANHQNGGEHMEANVINAAGISEADVKDGHHQIMNPCDDKNGMGEIIGVANSKTGSRTRMQSVKHLDHIPPVTKEMMSILSSIVEGVRNRAFSLAAEEVMLLLGLKEDIEILSSRLETVQAILSHAERKQLRTSSLQPWLKILKVAVLNADNSLDDITFEILRSKVETKDGARNRVHKFSDMFSLKMSREVKNINSCLQKICKASTKIEPGAIGLIDHTYVDDSEVVGRDDDVSNVVGMLLSSDNVEDLSVIRIVGVPGQGKTTLARLVYKNHNVTKHFDKRIWVSMSEDFEVEWILSEMLKSFTTTDFQKLNLKEIIRKLQPDLEGKRYCLVLDDVQNEIPEEWVRMIKSLAEIGGSRGSKIMVTSRVNAVAPAVLASVTYQLIGLSGEDSWTLFKLKAFSEGGVKRTSILEATGKRLVQSCEGVPLAIHALGAFMNTKTGEHEWLKTESSLNSDRTSPESSFLTTMMLSYSYLPSCLKHCFALCSVLKTQPGVFIKDELIQLWMALGLLHPPKGSNLTMEDIGSSYFNSLLKNSLLHNEVKDEFDLTVSCHMPDLGHDLSLYASKSYCLNVEGQEMNDISDIVHLSHNFASGSIPAIPKDSCQRLRTLVLNSGVLGDMITDFGSLRVLVLNSENVRELPSSIGEMKHLRYLDISMTKVKRLPDSISTLYNLQTLRLNNIKEFPKKFVNLINLRHLFIKECGKKCVFSGIGQLTSLQTLSFFVVNQDSGCKIEELGSLSNLKGKLKIYGLSDVRSVEEARAANLGSKSEIHALDLQWSSKGANEEHVMEALEPHSNIKGLTIANYDGKNFASWMRMETKSAVVLQNLLVIKLYYCNSRDIPSLGHLPYLKVVDIEGMSAVKRIGAEFYGYRNTSNGNGEAATTLWFPALRTLSLHMMDNLVEWIDAEHLVPPRTLVKVFPRLEQLTLFGVWSLITAPPYDFSCLRKLEIGLLDNVMALQKMSSKLTSLTSLRMEHAKGSSLQFMLEELLENNLSLRELRIHFCDGLLHLGCLGNLVGLEKVDINFCQRLNFISGIHLLTSLVVLRITDCLALVSVPDLPWLPRLKELEIGPLSGEHDDYPFLSAATNVAAPLLPSLEILILNHKSMLKSLPHQIQHLSALKRLEIQRFEKLEALPQWLGNLSSLESLQLHFCSKLTEMPEAVVMKRLTRLRSLEVTWCYALIVRCINGSRPEWHKISHIPFIKMQHKTIQSL